ncbi:cofilin [Dipsacomyces acuminosporus]|nr:cofilin [Dipsacomyces acuminosporus]
MSSGVGVNGACLEAYNELKLKHTSKYIIFKLSDDNKEIVVEKTSADKDYEGFLGDLPEQECRYAVYDFEFEKEGTIRNKILFYAWSPDTAKIKGKMLYASSKDALRKALVGIATDIQGTDLDEVSHTSVLEKVVRSVR